MIFNIPNKNPIYRFRPLSGSYISQLRQSNQKKQSNKVSVPYRGATFLNNEGTLELELEVSVPYRGATFLNTIPATPCPVWDE